MLEQETASGLCLFIFIRKCCKPDGSGMEIAMVDAKKIEFEFKKYMDIYKADPELGHLMQQMTFQELFNEKFMKENSKFASMDDMLFKSDFGLTNPLEIEKVNQDKWNAFIAKNTECENWHQFGKLAMIEWMKTVIDLWAQLKEKRAKDAKNAKKAEKKAQKEKE
ncbi:hypothetical protein [Succiniclasticum ruminis]|nr:hypothetical protein [Succiniclasticum ruminis]